MARRKPEVVAANKRQTRRNKHAAGVQRELKREQYYRQLRLDIDERERQEAIELREWYYGLSTHERMRFDHFMKTGVVLPEAKDWNEPVVSTPLKDMIELL